MGQYSNWLSKGQAAQEYLKEIKQNWFFYWKSSPALWENELVKVQQSRPLLVPINWSYHLLRSSEFDQNFGPERINELEFDFGEYIHNGNLFLLSELAEKLHLELYFLLPLTPVSFLPNGGLPSFLSLEASKGKENLVKAYLDRDSNIHKMYSFFQPNVYHCFRKFCYSLSKELQKEGRNNINIMTAEYGAIENGRFESYLNDRSQAFIQGYEKFARYKTQVEKDENFSRNEQSAFTYQQQVSELYSQSAGDYLESWIHGHLRVPLAGGSQWDLMKRSSSKWDYSHELFSLVLESLSQRLLPSLVLLSENTLGHDLLTQMVSDLMTRNYFEEITGEQKYNEDEWGFAPMSFFRLFGGDYYQNESVKDFLKSLGLQIFFNSYFPWSYTWNDHIVHIEEDEIDEESVGFYFGKFLSLDNLNTVYKSFFNGQKIIVDLSNLNVELRSKFEVFISENNFQKEEVNFFSPIRSYTLGTGKLIVFESQYLEDRSLKEKIQFWVRLSQYLELVNIPVLGDDDIVYFWLTRKTNSQEFKYKEVRRIYLYNPTNYKKKVYFESVKNFALIKFSSDQTGEVNSKLSGLEVVLDPFTRKWVDYGEFDQI
jgi:hypothetical protein